MPRFDSEKIIQQTIGQVMLEYGRVAMRLWWGGGAGDPAAPYTSSPLRAELELLLRVANGEIDRATCSEDTFFEVHGTLQDLCELLWVPPGGTYGYHIPADWWTQPGIGEVCGAVNAWLSGDDLITLTEAAGLLYPDAPSDSTVTLKRVQRLIERGKLQAFQTSEEVEPNPRRRQRVKRSAVLRLKEGQDAAETD